MKWFILILVIPFLQCGLSCDEYKCPKDDPNRVGSICNDGTTSDATGSGACSHHGGVREWRCCQKN